MTLTTKEPLPLRWIRAHGLKALTPWHLIEKEPEREALRREYSVEVSNGSQPARDIYPFARRQDQDDVAGFVIADGIVTEAVVVVHLTWTAAPERPGYPGTTRFENLWQWLKSVIDDTAEWCSEEDLPTDPPE